MALYAIIFYDHGGNVRATHYIERFTDAAAIAEADRLNVLPHMFSGFEIWDGERLVQQLSNTG